MKKRKNPHDIQNGKCAQCGCSAAFITKFNPKCGTSSEKDKLEVKKAAGIPVPKKVCCPKCKSESFTANRKGYGLGKGVSGGLILGPVGLLAGMAGSKQVQLTCLSCGKTWRPGG